MCIFWLKSKKKKFDGDDLSKLANILNKVQLKELISNVPFSFMLCSINFSAEGPITQRCRQAVLSQDFGYTRPYFSMCVNYRIIMKANY